MSDTEDTTGTKATTAVRSPGQVDIKLLPEVQKTKNVYLALSAADVRKRDENENRAKRKRYSYPLLGSYEKELPGIHRLPLSPVKSLQPSKDVFRKPSILSPAKGTNPQSSFRRASASLADNRCPDFDIYDPMNSCVETFAADTFNYQRDRLIRRHKKTEVKDSFSKLPDEMVLKIFSFVGKGALFNCLLVNQRFTELASDEVLWRRVDVIGKFITQESVKTIFRRKPVCARLARSLVPAPRSDIEKFTASQLLYLDLSMAEITAHDLARIMSMCTSLTKCSLESLCVTAEVIEGMMSFASSIDTLNLTMCYDVNFEAFRKFISTSRKLNSLNLGCMLQSWTNEELKIIVNTLPVSLERLNVSGFVYRMTDGHVQALVNRLLRLRELDLSDSQEITHMSVQYIVENLKVLERLSLSRCYNIRIGAYLLLPTAPKIRYVQLFAIFKEPTMSELQSTLPQIKFNTEPFSTIARPTVGNRRSVIWGMRVRD